MPNSPVTCSPQRSRKTRAERRIVSTGPVPWSAITGTAKYVARPHVTPIRSDTIAAGMSPLGRRCRPRTSTPTSVAISDQMKMAASRPRAAVSASRAVTRSPRSVAMTRWRKPTLK